MAKLNSFPAGVQPPVAKADRARRMRRHEREIDYAQRAAIYAIEFQEAPELSFIKGLFQSSSISVLEVPCGCGRLTLHLANMAAKVTAVDKEPTMIVELQRRFDERTGRKVRAIVGDMRTFRIPAKFQWVICPGEAFQLLPSREDALQALQTFRHHLGRQGRLVLDIATFRRNAVNKTGHPEYFDPDLDDGETTMDWKKPREGGSMLMRSHRQWFHKDRLEVQFNYAVRESGRLREKFFTRIALRRYSLNAISQILSECGLQVVNVYGDYDRRPFDRNSARLILVAEAQP